MASSFTAVFSQNVTVADDNDDSGDSNDSGFTKLDIPIETR